MGRVKGGNTLTLEEKMIHYRAKEGISQTELANRCGVTLQTIWAVETGQQTPSRVTREKILMVIGREDVE